MNYSFHRSVSSFVLTAVLLTTSACSKNDSSAAVDPHAGHDHGKKAEGLKAEGLKIEIDPHAGHNHGAAAGTSASAGQKICGEHNVPEAECGICNPLKPGILKAGESLKLRLASNDSAGIAGVETAPASVGTAADTVECYAEISFNQNKQAQIVAPLSGIVQEVSVDLGSLVGEKATVARIWSASLAEAVAKAILSHQTLDRERSLRSERVSSQKDLQEAEAAHRSACQPLRIVGFTEEQIDILGTQAHDKILLDLRAPFAGEIVERNAVVGSQVEAGKPLFTLVDRSRMWAMLSLPEASLARVKVGQTVELRVDSLPDKVFLGKLTWIGAEVDEKTRMTRVRAEVSNPEGQLKAKMFAQARIITRSTEGALLLPSSAIQRVDGNPLVFVKLEEDLFDARAVRLGAKFNGRQEIVSGLKAGELVAVNHSFSLKSALLISRLGAGCADD